MNTGDDSSSLGHVVWTTNLQKGEGGRWMLEVRLVIEEVRGETGDRGGETERESGGKTGEGWR